MKLAFRLAAVLVAVCLSVLSGPTGVAAGQDRVGGFASKAMKVRLDKAGGAKAWRTVTANTKVYLRDAAGAKELADINELTRGARVVGKRVVGGKVRAITLQERPATGSADCSFDSDEGDGDEVSNEYSFDCSHDYDDGRVDTDTDCSYDSSQDGTEHDWSMDASWDCSYSETDDRDDDNGGLDWDCSYSVSAGAYGDAGGRDVDADLDFDCSWTGAGTESALWDCRFMPGALGFRCVSQQLKQEFEYQINTEDMSVVGGMDFQRDVVSEPNGADVDCSGNATDGFDCSVDGESGTDDCAVDWFFDRSAATRAGDVSGSLSYSCSSWS